ncbi:MAG: hypothetical protein K6F50_06855 [Kiritimatiellae bacterium]|nr:hypothetical protein [Kiritimatiellia bacterium]
MRTRLALAAAMVAIPAFAEMLALEESGTCDLTAEMGYRAFSGARKLEIGNYDVKVTFGGDSASTNWVKFAGRRLLFDNVVTRPGERRVEEATVRVPGPYVTAKSRANDNRELKVEVFTTSPNPPQVEFAPSHDSPTLYLMGDSTTTDQRFEPWGSWGQIAPAFFRKGLAVSNFARSGLAMCTAESEGRVERLLEHLRAGDFVLIQFGHNDQKRKGEEPENGYARRLGEWTGLIEAKGAKVVVATPIERRRFKGGVQQPRTLADYSSAARAFASSRNLPLVDMNEKSYAMMGAAGEEGSTRFQCWYAEGEYPGADRTINDNTHHSVYGAYEMARIEAAEIFRLVPELGEFVRENRRSFDPLSPDPDPGIPPSNAFNSKKPAGN